MPTADRRPEGILRESTKLFLLLCEHVTDYIITLAIARNFEELEI